jgi:hypothetical protein
MEEGVQMFATTQLRLVGALVISSALAALLALVAFSSDAQANHSWGNYHWARTSNPFTLNLGANVSGPWGDHLYTTSSDWSQSTVLDTTKGAGGTSPKPCKATSGRVEVCNATYGNNGWLGLAQIWLSGRHITQGVAKLNDTYFNRAPYNTSAWRQMVMCQEVGHTFGLDHQDENNKNANLGTCMDYTNNPSTNQHPNQHDYDQLELIYSHTDNTTTVAPASAASTMPPAANRGSFNSRAAWGRLVEESPNGKLELWERSFGGEARMITWVIRP